MKKPSKSGGNDRERFQSLIGLGDFSARKSYYPALQETIGHLRNEKEKFERIFSGALNGIFQATLQGRTTIANPAMAEMCGYTSPMEFTTTVQDIGSLLFHKEPVYNRLVAQLRHDGFVINYEAELRRKDNAVIIVSMNARLNEISDSGYIEFIVQDITDRKRDEEELRKHREHLEELVRERTVAIEKAHQALVDSEERFRSLSEASFEGIIIVDGLKIIEANKAIGRMLGYEPTDMIGMRVDNFVSSVEKNKVKEKIVADDKQPYESSGQRKDGSSFPLELHARLFSYRGRQVRVFAVRDITEKKKAEAEIKTLRGILPICASCKKIRDDQGYWNQIEGYIRDRSEAEFSHGICPECANSLYSDFLNKS